jgi:hypothetical protein
MRDPLLKTYIATIIVLKPTSIKIKYLTQKQGKNPMPGREILSETALASKKFCSEAYL